jgi:16S rRNA (guanine1207-N2)-methyltransferase
VQTGVNLNHYFTDNPSLPHHIQKITYEYAQNHFVFTTDAGLFSKDHIDPASDFLLHQLPPLSGSLLDMGCGYGCIGIVLAKTHPIRLVQADITQTACTYTQKNCQDNGVVSQVICSDGFEKISDSFHTIVINPPIHAGKAVTYRMYEDSFNHLLPNGCLYIVTYKKHGAESTITKCQSIFGNCTIIKKKKGCYVLCCVKTPA